MNLEVLTELEILSFLSSALLAMELHILVAPGVLLEMRNVGSTAAEHSGLGKNK